MVTTTTITTTTTTAAAACIRVQNFHFAFYLSLHQSNQSFLFREKLVACIPTISTVAELTTITVTATATA